MSDYNKHWKDHGCTDGACIIQRPEGMHTNGGCQCDKAIARAIPIGKRVALINKLAYADKAHAENERLREALERIRLAASSAGKSEIYYERKASEALSDTTKAEGEKVIDTRK